jgi:hypothetical protein
LDRLIILKINATTQGARIPRQIALITDPDGEKGAPTLGPRGRI